MDFYSVPLVFGMALAMNAHALKAYSAMTEQQKQVILDKAHHAGSEQEMRQIVNSIIKQKKQPVCTDRLLLSFRVCE